MAAVLKLPSGTTYEDADVHAIQALFNDATHARALDWILFKACRLGTDPFTPGKVDATAYGLGRNAVGMEIYKLKDTVIRSTYVKRGRGKPKEIA